MSITNTQQLLFFYADVQHLHTLTEDIDSFVKEIWSEYGEYLRLLKEGNHELIASRIKLGTPYSTDMFDIATDEILQAYLTTESFRKVVQSFASAAMYQRRCRGSEATLPSPLFERLVKECDHPDWKKVAVKDGVTCSKRSVPDYDGIYRQEKCVLNCRAEVASAYLHDFTRQPEWETSVKMVKKLEHLGDGTDIIHKKVAPLGPMEKKKDFVLLRCEKDLGNGVVGHLRCSVDHKDAPEDPKHGRAFYDMSGYLIRPNSKDPNTCEYIYIFKINLGRQPFFKLFMSDEYVLTRSAQRVNNLKKILEKYGSLVYSIVSSVKSRQESKESV